MEILIKILQFFMAFTLIVGIHELGHFIVARLFGIRVEKFYILFDPWFSLFKFKRGDTEYGLGWLPLGGYVKIAGMIDESMDTEQMKQPVKPDEFRAKPAWQRFLVMIAGVVMNVILAVAIFCGISWAWGESYFDNADARWGYNFSEAGHVMGFEDGDRFVSIDGEPVGDINGVVNALLLTSEGRTVTVERRGREVTFDIPFDKLLDMRHEEGYKNLFTLRQPVIVDSLTERAAASGLLHGDEITAADDVDVRGDFGLFTRLLDERRDSTVRLTVLRGGATEELTASVDGDGKIGFTVANPYAPRTRHYTLLQSIPAGFKRTGKMISSYWQQLKLIFQPKSKMYEELGGFIAIGSIFPSEWNWADFWFKTAFLSVILAVMNIIPIPGLDGGHALFTLWEMVTGHRPSDKFLEVMQYIGLGLLLILLVYANGNDIYRFFIK